MATRVRVPAFWTASILVVDRAAKAVNGSVPAAYDRAIKAVSERQLKTGKIEHVFLTDAEVWFFALAGAAKPRDELMFR